MSTTVAVAAPPSVIGRLAASPTLLWSVFVLAHLWLGWLNLFGPGNPYGDVAYVYKFWAQQAVYAHYFVGIDGPFVYPLLALLPVLASAVLGFGLYGSTWLSGVMLLDLVAFAFLTGWGRSPASLRLGWWWVIFLLALGPIAVGRIDSVTVPIAIVGVLFLATRPRLATALLTIATWVKVWPAAIIAALIIGSRDRMRVFAAAIVTSGVIVACALVLGSGTNVFSFITQQTGRGLQIEAPVSTPWLWLAWAHLGGTGVYYDQGILTFQVAGAGTSVASALMNPVLGLAVVVVAVLGVISVRRGAAVTELLPTLSLALVTTFIAFNKVGSPQYMTWLAVPVLLGLAVASTGHGRSFRVPATIVLVLALLTQGIYPYLYDYLLQLNPAMLLVLSARNLLVFGLLGWSLLELGRVSRAGAPHERMAPREDWLPVVWPWPRQNRGSVDADEGSHP